MIYAPTSSFPVFIIVLRHTHSWVLSAYMVLPEEMGVVCISRLMQSVFTQLSSLVAFFDEL